MPDSEKPWMFTDAEREKLVTMMGLSEDRIDEIELSRKQQFDAAKEYSRGGMSEDEARSYFFDKYGFDHDCRCIEDEMLGQTLEVSECFSNMVDAALETLEQTIIERDELRAGAETLEADINALRLQVAELGGTPRF